MSKPGNNGGVAADHLLSFVQRVERMNAEIKVLQDDRKEIFAEAKAMGFDPKTMRKVIALRALDEADRQEQEALLDIYKAALGMLKDTPLGAAAIKRLSDPPEKPAEQRDIEDRDDKEDPPTEAAEPETPAGPTLEEAAEQGRQAALDSKPVTANPFPAGDPRRARWDESWCMAAGSDGMEIPAAWRRNKKPDAKPGEGKPA